MLLRLTTRLHTYQGPATTSMLNTMTTLHICLKLPAYVDGVWLLTESTVMHSPPPDSMEDDKWLDSNR